MKKLMSEIYFVFKSSLLTLLTLLLLLLLTYYIFAGYTAYKNNSNNKNKGQDINIVINGRYLNASDFNDPFEMPDTLTILDIKNGYVKYSYLYKGDMEIITSSNISKLRPYLKELK